MRSLKNRVPTDRHKARFHDVEYKFYRFIPNKNAQKGHLKLPEIHTMTQGNRGKRVQYHYHTVRGERK